MTPTKRSAKASKQSQPDRSERPMVRTSERSSFNACRFQWQLAYVDRLETREARPPLRFGSLVHKALELRYPPGLKRGPHPARTFEKLYQESLDEAENKWGFKVGQDDDDRAWADALDIGVDMLEMYVEQYGRDEDIEVIASEMSFSVPVFARPAGPDDPIGHPWIACNPDADGAVHLFNYAGTIDGVWRTRIDGRVRINDYKTCSGDPIKEAQSKGVLDEQATAYWTWGADALVDKGILRRTGSAKKHPNIRDLDGMLYTFLHKGKRDPRPKNAQGQSLNKDNSVSKKQPVPMFHRELVYRSEADQDAARQRAVDQFVEMQACRLGELPIYKSPGTGYPNQQCKGCEFRDVCELHEIGEDWQSLARATLVEWDPYSAQAIESEGR